MKLIVLLLGILVCTQTGYSQNSKPTIAPAPDWITKNQIDYNKTNLDKEATDGYIDVSLEQQVLLASQSIYTRRIKKIISGAGVQNGSEISVSYDPAYEKLTFHTIRVIRNGELINQLKLSNIKTVHQEEDLKNFIYNGSLNAIVILDDIRKGDIIEYSYTINGFNPIFKNKYSDEYTMNFGDPIYNIYYKLIVPSGRNLNFKNFNYTKEPIVSSLADTKVYEWHSVDIPPQVLQDFTPKWFNAYSRVQISEFNSWKEVNDWALALFPINKILSPALQKKISEIDKSAATDEEKTKLVLKFIQDDIRYMGIEIGEHSHKPADPSKIFFQRFGDCKEKSYLACCMLRAMHIEAVPVLINTEDKKELFNYLPAPINFDHTTIRVKIGADWFWFDPTISYQRGDIKNIFYPDFQAGLVVTDTTTVLTPIRFRDVSSLNVKEYFRVTDMSGSGTLKISTIFKGKNADETRNDFNNSSITEMLTTYQKFYSSYYPDIKGDSLLKIDDDSSGDFTTIEYYTIPKFWNEDKLNIKRFSFSAFVISAVLRSVKEKQRKMPISLAFPLKVKEEITIELPEQWSVTEAESHAKNASYSYNYHFYSTENIVHLTADYENLKDYVALDETGDYFRDINFSNDFASFDISTGSELSSKQQNSTGANNNYNVSALLLIGVVAGGLIWWGKKR